MMFFCFSNGFSNGFFQCLVTNGLPLIIIDDIYQWFNQCFTNGIIFPMIDWFTIMSPCHQWCFLLFQWFFQWFFPMLGDQWFTNPHNVPVMAIPWCPASLHGSHAGRCSQPLGRDVQLRRGVEASMFGGRSRWALLEGRGLDIANHQTKITK
jgi:hypothetical protein